MRILLDFIISSLCNVCQLYDCCLENGEAHGRSRLVRDVAGARLMSSTAPLPVQAVLCMLLTRFSVVCPVYDHVSFVEIVAVCKFVILELFRFVV